MDELNWGGGKNRQQKREKQKQKAVKVNILLNMLDYIKQC